MLLHHYDSMARTSTISMQEYRGTTVVVVHESARGWPPCCPPGLHRLQPMLHYDEYGTGFLECTECDATADDPFDSLEDHYG